MQLFPFYRSPTVLRQLARIGWTLCLLLAIASHSTAAENDSRLLVLGDSISAAYGMSLEQGWVALLDEALVANEHDIQVINASISGETTVGGLRRLPGLLDEHRPRLVVIELGGNDGLRGYPLAQLQDNLTQMVKLSQDSGARVILVPIEIPPNYGRRYTRGFRGSYDRVAGELNATLAPFILDGVATVPGLMQDDGIHPTAQAQTKLLANLLPTISAELEKL